MVMFGKAIERVGAKPVRPRLYQRMIINTLPFFFRGSVLWVAALIGEEIFDSLQRQMMDDPELQPIIQRLMRIHVTEEARHIQFARDGLRKRAPADATARTGCSSATSTAWAGGSSATCSPTQSRMRAPAWTRRRRAALARNSPHRHEVQVAGFAPLAAVPDRGRSDGPDCAPRMDAQQVPVIERSLDVVIIGGEPPVSARQPNCLASASPTS